MSEESNKKEENESLARPWVIAIAVLCFCGGMVLQQVMTGFMIGALVNIPITDTTTTTTTTTGISGVTTTTTIVPVTHFELVEYKNGYYKLGESYYLRFFDITIRETSGMSGTVVIRCEVSDIYGHLYQQENSESFNGHQEKLLDYRIAIPTSVWSNDEIVWSTVVVTLVGES